MYRIFPILTILLLAPWSLPSSSAGTDSTDTDDLLNDALDRFREAHESQREDHRIEATLYLRDHLFTHSLVPTEASERAWQENLSRPADDPAAVYAAEAALLDLARQNVDAALDADDVETLDLWMRLAFSRTTRDGWTIPSWSTERAQEAHAQNVTKDLHAVLASRARETLVTALLLERAGLHGEARSTADGATALLQTFYEDAATRLPQDLARPFIENATRGRGIFFEVPAERKADTWTGLLGPLVALEMDRTIEQLDVFAMRNVDAALSAARAAEEAPHLKEVLSQQAWLQYAADRAGLYLRGEGGVDRTDEAYAAFENDSAGIASASIQEAALAVRAGLTELGLLHRGIVLKVETGGVRPDRVHDYRVTLVRPPLEGIAAYRFTILFDAEVVKVTGARPFGQDHWPAGRDWQVRPKADRIVLEVTPDDPLRRSTHLATLQIEARGPPGAESPLAIRAAAFTEPDGDAATVAKLRDGHATVATLPQVNSVAESPSLPAASTGALLVLLLLFSRGARRHQGTRDRPAAAWTTGDSWTGVLTKFG